MLNDSEVVIVAAGSKHFLPILSLIFPALRPVVTSVRSVRLRQGWSLLNVMELISNCPDARLRDLCNSWMIFDRGNLPIPAGVVLHERQLGGFLYVDHEQGFLLRVESELAAVPNGALRGVQDLSKAGWDIPYSALSQLALRQATAKESKTLGFSPRPYSLWRHFRSSLEKCRKRTSLDCFRIPGNPDQMWARVRVGKQLPGDRVLVRLGEESLEGDYDDAALDWARAGVAPSLAVVRPISACKTGYNSGGFGAIEGVKLKAHVYFDANLRDLIDHRVAPSRVVRTDHIRASEPMEHGSIRWTETSRSACKTAISSPFRRFPHNALCSAKPASSNLSDPGRAFM